MPRVNDAASADMLQFYAELLRGLEANTEAITAAEEERLNLIINARAYGLAWEPIALAMGRQTGGGRWVSEKYGSAVRKALGQ